MHEFRLWSAPGIAGILLLAASAMDGPDATPAPERLAAEALAGPVAARVERVVDGDTIEVRAKIWLGQIGRAHV